MSAVAILVVMGNVVVLLAALFGAGRWFRNWLIKTVSEPIEQLKLTVTETNTVATQAQTDSARANQRLDRLYETLIKEGHPNA